MYDIEIVMDLLKIQFNALSHLMILQGILLMKILFLIQILEMEYLILSHVIMKDEY